jgi:hypothetical protein
MPSQTYCVTGETPVAIVVHCSDPRFQQAFAGFVHHELKFKEGQYIPLVISGGVGSLSEPLKLPKEFKFMKERIELFIDRFDSISQIILINHEDCRHYAMLHSTIGKLFLRNLPTLNDRQKADLGVVAEGLRKLLNTRIEVKVFYARFADIAHTQVTFEQIVS